MPSGLLFPYSVDPITVGVYNGVYIGGGSGAKNERCTKVAGSIAADAKVDLYYAIPDPLPSGTLTLRPRARAAATTGNAKFNPKWVAVAASGADPSSATLVAEGTQTYTWSSGDTDDYKSADLTLDATTAPTAGQILVMQMWFETSSWTLAVVSGWNFPVLWV